MRIKIIGDSDCARALRGLLRKAGFAVSEYLPPELVKDLPSGGYVVYIEEAPLRQAQGPEQSRGAAGALRQAQGPEPQGPERSRGEAIHFDSVDCELEANILRHVTSLWKHPVGLNRPGGRVHSDQEIRILVPPGNEAAALAVEFGVLRGLTDTIHGKPTAPRLKKPWYRRWFRSTGSRP